MDYIVTFEDGSSAYLAHYGVKGMKWKNHKQIDPEDYGYKRTKAGLHGAYAEQGLNEHFTRGEALKKLKRNDRDFKRENAGKVRKPENLKELANRRRVKSNERRLAYALRKIKTNKDRG